MSYTEYAYGAGFKRTDGKFLSLIPFDSREAAKHFVKVNPEYVLARRPVVHWEEVLDDD